MIKVLRFFLFLLFFSCIHRAHAESYTLYDKLGSPVNHYLDILYNLKNGDEVQFSNGRTFKLGKFLGEGSNTRVFAISPSKAIRISSVNSKLTFNYSVMYFDGYQLLKGSGIPIPYLYEDESVREEYIIVERISVWFNLYDFYQNRGYEDIHRGLLTDLLEFYTKTIFFEYIRDSKPSNIVYDGEKWLLIDWFDDVRMWDRKALSNDFISDLEHELDGAGKRELSYRPENKMRIAKLKRFLAAQLYLKRLEYLKRVY